MGIRFADRMGMSRDLHQPEPKQNTLCTQCQSVRANSNATPFVLIDLRQELCELQLVAEFPVE
jgi:hypothetical protein